MAKHIHTIKGKKSEDTVTVAIMASQPIPNMKSKGPRCLLNYKNKSVLDHQINLINSAFENPEIILLTGFGSKEIFQKKPDEVRMVENQLFDSTRGMEDIRLVLSNTHSNNIIFLPDNILISKEELVALSKCSMIVASPYELSEKSPIVESGILQDFVYYKQADSFYFANVFSLLNRELKIASNFCWKNAYEAYLDSEVLSEVAKEGGMIKVMVSNKVEFLI